jgi:hypothetical protein
MVFKLQSESLLPHHPVSICKMLVNVLCGVVSWFCRLQFMPLEMQQMIKF